MCSILKKKKKKKKKIGDAFDLLKLNGTIKMESRK